MGLRRLRPREERSERGVKLASADRLRHTHVHAGGKVSRTMLLLRLGDERNDRQLGRRHMHGANAARGLDAIEVGYHGVEHHEVAALGGNGHYRCAAGADHLMAQAELV